MACEGVVRGTHNSPSTTPEDDIAPTERKVEVNVAAFFDIATDGLNTEDRTYFDNAVMMSQLGLGD